MSTRRTRKPSRTNSRPTTTRALRSVWLPFAIVVLVIIGGGAFFLTGSRGRSTASSGGLPGPLGGPNVAQDVNTLVGKPAPPFTLSDSEGVAYDVTPGQGKPLVLVSHMGIT